MSQGTIVRITDRGFGFIKPDVKGKDVFFHMSALSGFDFDDLEEGMRVEYEEGIDPKKGTPRATSLRVTE